MQGSHLCWVFCLFFVATFKPTFCWDSEELELFDLVEEVNTNFYTLLGVEQNADSKEIRQAFRKLSLVLHPDKNDAEDADVKFRQLVAIHEVLKDQNLRKRYDEVLEHGLPDWRHAVYYYRRVRKMGLLEMFIILFIIITISQYVVGWAAYLDKRLIADEIINNEKKRLQRKARKKKMDIPEMNIEIPKPSIKNTLPFQIPRFIWACIVFVPSSVGAIKEYLEERKKKKLEEESSSEEEEEQPVQVRGPRRRKNFTLPEVKEEQNGCVLDPLDKPKVKKEPAKPPIISGGLWTDDDLAELIRLVNKFPQGTLGRWDIIADAMRRPVTEVTVMAKKVKEGMVVKVQEEEVEEILEEPKKVKTKGGKLGNQIELEEQEWTQVQQEALEEALTKYTKQTLDRWEKVAKVVPGKTKEECMVRYRQLVEIIKKKKKEESKDN